MTSTNAAQALIAFLHCEATQAEQRAKSLRATAATIEANSNEGGRSGGSKKKRKRDGTIKNKRAPTAYTLFVHENYDMIKNTPGNNHTASREIMSLVAQQWAQTSETEKQMWHFRAEQMKGASAAVLNEEDEIPELPNDGGGKKRGRKPRASAAAVDTGPHVSV